MTAIAQRGMYDAARYASRSEARYAVLVRAASIGLTFRDVVARVEDGRWPGLASMYARYADARKALGADWAKATVSAAASQTEPQVRQGKRHVRRSNTSHEVTHGGVGGILPSDGSIDAGAATGHEEIRTWRTALRLVEQQRFPGRAGYSVRFALRALGGFAHATESTVVGVGVRSLAIAMGTDHTTAAAALKVAQQAGWIDKLEDARGVAADLYQLTIPQDVAESARQLRWIKGKSYALRPAFRELGQVAALVFEAVEIGVAATITELVTATGLSRSAVSEAVAACMAWSLLERDDAKRLTAHPERLAAAAEHLGVAEQVIEQIARYRRHRAVWHAWLARFENPDQAQAGDLDFDGDESWWWPPDDDVGAGWSILRAAGLD
jgi:hypothetical protein